MTNLLDVRDLRVEFQTQAGIVRAIDGLTFRVPRASSVALVGESGSGKSVTAQAILGILPRNGRVSGGHILFADPHGNNTPVDLAHLDPASDSYRAIRGNHISMIFQEPMTSLSPLHTAGDQISEALFLHRRIGRKDGRRATVDMLRLVGFPDPERAYNTYPFELSGGLRQRAMIAMALVCRPALLIADEPTTALDVTIQAQILKLIEDLQQEFDMALLLITHDLGVVANIAKEVVVMYHGKVMESGEIDDIFRDPRHPYLKALLKAVPHFDMKRGERLTPLREIEHEAGQLLVAHPSALDEKPSSPTLIAAHNLHKSFSTRKSGGLFGGGDGDVVKAVDDVSFFIERGKCLGLVGESGCGKSTVSKIVMRAINPDAGRITYYDGGEPLDVLALQGRELNAFRRKIQYVFQDPYGSLNPRMTVLEIVSEPLIIHGVGDVDYRSEMVTELMRAVGLDPRYLNRYPHSFSGGQRQRICIARALALRPELLICDEPVSALDVSVQAQILNLLKDLQAQLGLTLLFISHNLAVVDYMADTIAVMCAGRLVEEAPRELLFRNPVHPYTRALLAAVPFPDPDHQLDLSALMDGRASDPAAWPPPFDGDGAGAAAMIDLGGGHRVRARRRPAEVVVPVQT